MTKTLKTFGLSTLFVSALALAAASGAKAADVAAGEKVFKRCTACHQVGPDAKNKVGPTLNGIVGRAAGVSVGFNYGTGIVEARGAVGEDANGDGYLDTPEGFSGLVWTEENLLGYLEDPKQFLINYTKNDSVKARMALKLNKEDQRADVIAYLKTIGLDGKPAQ